MEFERDHSTTDEYYVTALQIFEYCGADSNGTVSVDALMEKFAPFVKTSKSEYSYLRSLLDPEECNPEISVTMLSNALNKYSDSQKTKIDLEESFNLKSGPAPQDSDSGISDGYQILEELQCELRGKARLASQLRSQLEFSDRQHEEAVAALQAEQDSLRTHLNMLREENVTLTHVRSDYEECCARLCSAESALADARRALEQARRTANSRAEKIAQLESDKTTLQELLNKSKEECHRINEMYASRQSGLIEQNEALRSECADLSAKLHDQEEVMQHVVREKVMIEMELKDMVNKSNHTALCLDRSIDVSFTDDQMLTALDTLNSDTRFAPGNTILDEESFIKALREDQGRTTNMSLFDEIKLSFGGDMSRLNNLDISYVPCDKSTETQTDCNPHDNNNDACEDCKHCVECHKYKEINTILKADLDKERNLVKCIQSGMDGYEDNLSEVQSMFDEEKKVNMRLKLDLEKVIAQLLVLDAECTAQKERLASLSRDRVCAECQTVPDTASVSTQAAAACLQCEKRADSVPIKKGYWRHLWDATKSLFSLFAALCFVGALFFLYQVSHYHYATRRCLREGPAVPWRWFRVHDLLDFVFRIEYVGEVPM